MPPLPKHKCPYYNDDCPLCCPKVMPPLEQDNWIERFDESAMSKYYGACFECCDFEKMMSEIKNFIKSELSHQRKLIVEKLERSKKPKIQRPIPCPEGRIGCLVYHCEEIEPQENNIISDAIKLIEDHDKM